MQIVQIAQMAAAALLLVSEERGMLEVLKTKNEAGPYFTHISAFAWLSFVHRRDEPAYFRQG